MKTALITGITGQDGAYLSRLLLDKGYRVVGAYRRGATLNLWRLRELGIADGEVELVPFELLEYENIRRVIQKVQPDEIYNLAAQTFVAASFEQPIYTTETNALGPMRILEAIREINPKIRFYQASTSEMFGKVSETPQSETTPFHPRSPYGNAKLYAHWATVNYREAYGLFACCGILFNHESQLRGTEFVTRKITQGLAQIRLGQKDQIALGNLDAKRDWGFAGDYVEGMWLMLQTDRPSDYILATGQTTSVRSFASLAAETLGFKLEWQGEGTEEQGCTNKPIIVVDPNLYRPTEVDLLVGDATRARELLGWEPKTSLHKLIAMMVEADLKRCKDGQLQEAA